MKHHNNLEIPQFKSIKSSLHRAEHKGIPKNPESFSDLPEFDNPIYMTGCTSIPKRAITIVTIPKTRDSEKRDNSKNGIS